MSSYKAKLFLETLKQSGVKEILLPLPREKPSILKSPTESSIEDFEKLRKQVLRCTQCAELVSNRRSVVFGSGNPRASLAFVGEAPGMEEDRQGLPFVGAAGQLLTKMIEAIRLKRDEVYIANVLKCRPPGNRTPRPKEIENCEPYLVAQLSFIQPKVICALGTFAAQTLLKTTTPISSLRGRVHEFQGIPVVCTFHPAYLLRNPGEKKKSWEDLKKLKAILDESLKKNDAQ